jgi:hypothetical protein
MTDFDFISPGPIRWVAGKGKRVTLKKGEIACIFNRDWDKIDKEMAGLSDRAKKEGRMEK